MTLRPDATDPYLPLKALATYRNTTHGPEGSAS